ncbi:MAG TPA: glycosyltransferase [Pirellulales bacterium]|nr:glycosyltransferase [Pirellulales bacterium]
MKRRIVHVVPTLGRGGAEKQLVLLAQHLPRDEFDVHVCAISQSGELAGELERSGIPVTVIGKHFKFDPLSWMRLRRYLRELKPDLAQTWMFTANAYGRAAAISAGVPKIVASERCVDSWKAPYQLAIDRRLARRTDAIIVNSRGVQDFYAENGIPPDKLRLIHNGISPDCDRSLGRAELLAKFELPENARLMGAVGRLWPQKRVKDLIWATDLLKVVHDNTHLLIIGDGPQRKDLERFREHINIEDKVRFLGARNDVPRLMPHFDLLLLASSFEGLSNAIMEAMVCAVPVVATDIPGNRELVVHGQTGFLVQVGDRAGLARCAYKILEDPELGRRLGEAGCQRVVSQFSIETMVQKHVALYRELLG